MNISTSQGRRWETFPHLCFRMGYRDERNTKDIHGIGTIWEWGRGADSGAGVGQLLAVGRLYLQLFSSSCVPLGCSNYFVYRLEIFLSQPLIRGNFLFIQIVPSSVYFLATPKGDHCLCYLLLVLQGILHFLQSPFQGQFPTAQFGEEGSSPWWPWAQGFGLVPCPAYFFPGMEGYFLWLPL